jgi:hypothetical protein
VYVQKVVLIRQSTIRRATESRVVRASTQINELIRQHGTSDKYGPASQNYWAVSHARLAEDAPVTEPTSTTFAQLQHVDAMQRQHDYATAQ